MIPTIVGDRERYIRHKGRAFDARTVGYDTSPGEDPWSVHELSGILERRGRISGRVEGFLARV